MKAIPPKLRYLGAGIVLLIAFLFMASIFVPDRLEAGEDDAAVERPPLPPAPSEAYSAASRDSAIPLGQIESNDHVVKFFATPTGPLYSVYGPDGRRLAELIPLDELHARFPNLGIDDSRADVSMEIIGTDVGGNR